MSEPDNPGSLCESEEPNSNPTEARFLGDDGCGYTMYVLKNKAGGHTFISSELGQVVWDTAAVSRGQLLKALDYELKIKHLED